MKKIILLFVILLSSITQAQKNQISTARAGDYGSNWIEAVFYTDSQRTHGSNRYIHVRSDERGLGCYEDINGDYLLNSYTWNGSALTIEDDNENTTVYNVLQSSRSTLNTLFNRNILENHYVNSSNRVQLADRAPHGIDFEGECAVSGFLEGNLQGIIEDGWYSVAVSDLVWTANRVTINADSLYFNFSNGAYIQGAQYVRDEFFLSHRLDNAYHDYFNSSNGTNVEHLTNVVRSGVGNSLTANFYPHSTQNPLVVSIITLNKTELPNISEYNTRYANFGSQNFVERHGRWFERVATQNPDRRRTGGIARTEDHVLWQYINIANDNTVYLWDRDRSCYINANLRLDYTSPTGAMTFISPDGRISMSLGRYVDAGSTYLTPKLSISWNVNDDSSTSEDEYSYLREEVMPRGPRTVIVCP